MAASAEKIKTLISQRLNSYGIETVSDTLVEYAYGRAAEYVLNFCNISEIPEGLAYAVADIACAGYLETSLVTGSLSGNASSVKVGDTQVTFGSESPTWSGIIDGLGSRSRMELLRYRKMCF